VLPQGDAVDLELPQGGLKVPQGRLAKKALDLDSNELVAALGRKRLLGPEVDFDDIAFVGQAVGVVRDGPPVPDQRVAHGTVNPVLGRHRLPSRVVRCRDYTWPAADSSIESTRTAGRIRRRCPSSH
jgi:hypothetical protein